jgi:hypothetical protein
MIGDEENIGLGQALYIYFVIIKKINDNEKFTDDEVLKDIEVFKNHKDILYEAIEKDLISEKMQEYLLF